MCDSQFDSLPWLSIKTDACDCYLVKYSVDNLFVKIMICDLCYVYDEIMSADEALQRFTSLNNNIEIQMKVLIQEIQNMFHNLTNNLLVCNVSQQYTNLVLKASVKLFGDINVEWQSILKRSSPEIFQKQFTIPLLALNHNLNSSVNDLKQIVLKKDRQINDYKMQRAKLIVKHFETAEFNEDEFMNKRCSQEYLESSFGVTSKTKESCLKLAEDRCFHNICKKIYCKRENHSDKADSVMVEEPIDETQEELRKRKELDEIIKQKPSAMPRKKKLNL